MVLSLVSSLTLGTSGNYNIFGIKVAFEDPGCNVIWRVANGIFLGAYLDFLIHEMGHSLGGRITYGNFGRVVITSDGAGHCFLPERNEFTSLYYDTIFMVCGPLLQYTWHVVKSCSLFFAFKSTASLQKYRTLNGIRKTCILWAKAQAYISTLYNLTEIGYFLLSSVLPGFSKRDPRYIYEGFGLFGLLFWNITFVALDALSIKIIRKIA